ncbi:MAG TPA: MBL fold metallo-hydrolase [Pyrinomonadaceae bacterium]|jgi:beta-lactamase superfamily II metal-dependent hydrolase
MTPLNEAADANDQTRIHLLDVGPDEYGDAILCQFGDRSVLIDGSHPGDHQPREGHPSIPQQLATLLEQQEPITVDLLIITHAHQDHIGCVPKLVADERLNATWALVIDPGLGWGRAPGEDRDSAFAEDPRVLTLAAALREEPRIKLTGEALDQFLADALTLEDRYNQMLATLDQRGTRIIRFGRQSTQALGQEFADIGLKIIGPSQEHVLNAAEIINNLSHDSLERAADIFRQDNSLDVASAYKRIVTPDFDSIDVVRPGPAVNLQSIITRFEFKGKKYLFAGDFQFSKPEVNSVPLANSVRRLRRKVSQEAPFAFYKISHHASHNAFSEEIYDELNGTPLFGTCAGQSSTHHPSRDVLNTLREHRTEIKWLRTDRNGLVTLTFGPGEPQIKKAKGRVNDFQPNDVDIPVPVPEPIPKKPAPSPAQGQTPKIVVSSARGEVVEVTAKIPHTTTRVTITVDVSPRGDQQVSGTGAATDAVRIGGGRALPELLFVTSRDALVEHIGQLETATLIDSFHAQNMTLFDSLPANATRSSETAPLVREQLEAHPNARGVVIVGGYNVVPSQILDSLPSGLRQSLPPNDDPDRFIVWSDEIYGDLDGDGLPEIPVSRIPDGRSASLVYRALQSSGPGNSRRAGVRNVARPFARQIFNELPGDGPLLVSKMAVFNQNPAIDLAADQVYLMLHGDFVDASRFWGEGTPNNLEAINLSNLPDEFKGVVFTGCCWGALTVDTPAGRVVPGRSIGLKTAESSIALGFLARGASAFIGCTGAHYSPTEEPFNYFGGPMHRAFWSAYNAGKPPAQALFDAKIDYIRGMPHGRTGVLQTAIEYKILRQYTCLGLGW